MTTPSSTELTTRIAALEKLNAQLAAEIGRMRPIVDVVIGHNRDLGFGFPVQIEAAIDTYEASQPK